MMGPGDLCEAAAAAKQSRSHFTDEMKSRKVEGFHVMSE